MGLACSGSEGQYRVGLFSSGLLLIVEYSFGLAVTECNALDGCVGVCIGTAVTDCW